MITIYLLSGLRESAGTHELRISSHRGTVSALLKDLCDRHGPAFSGVVFPFGEAAGRNPFLKILVDGADIQDADPELSGDETIFLFLPIAGG